MQQKFERITVVGVTGLTSNTQALAHAIAISQGELPGSRGLLIAPNAPALLDAAIEHVVLGPMGYLDYSLFMLYGLSQFITTDFALVVQDDGWVISGGNWNDRFFDYDYIGAPTHLALLDDGADGVFMDRFSWVNAAQDTLNVVMNGGFSLRSRALLSAPKLLELPVVVPPVSHLVGPPMRMKWQYDVPFEDVQLCAVMKKPLARAGLCFAPLELAKSFSVEHLNPSLHDGFDVSALFGHHSRLRKLDASFERRINYPITLSQITAIFGETHLIDLFEGLGYAVETGGGL